MTRSRCLVLLAVMILATAVCSWGQVVISVRFGPPVLPVYAQPICPSPGYIWVPGYWAWSPDADGYYWVPGTWALAPEPGFLWTPGYWGFYARGYLLALGIVGADVSAFTVALTMDTAIPAPAITVDTGATAHFYYDPRGQQRKCHRRALRVRPGLWLTTSTSSRVHRPTTGGPGRESRYSGPPGGTDVRLASTSSPGT